MISKTCNPREGGRVEGFVEERVIQNEVTREEQTLGERLQSVRLLDV